LYVIEKGAAIPLLPKGRSLLAAFIMNIQKCTNCGRLGEDFNNISDVGILCNSCYSKWKHEHIFVGEQISEEELERLKKDTDL